MPSSTSSSDPKSGGRGRGTRLLLGLAVGFWVLDVLVRWSSGAPLGHDEARYALDASDVLRGAPARFWYSAPGMTLVALPGILGGGSEYALRVVPIVLGLGFLWSVWNLARTVRGETTAAWTVAAIATSPLMATHSGELLSDLPSATCLLVAITVLVQELSRAEGIRRRIIWVAPLCAGAFYLRYGSTAPIIVIGVVFVIVGHRALLRRPWPVAIMLVLFALLLAPHAVRSVQHTGSVIGILRLSAAIPGEAQGLLAYVRDPLAMYGIAVAPLALVGLLAPGRDRYEVALQFVAVGHVCLLAATTQAQPRFVVLALVLLTMAGVDVLVRWVSRRTHLHTVAVVAAAVIVLVMCVVNVVIGVTTYPASRRDKYPRTFIAANAIRANRDPARRCEVEAASDRTRLEWYSRCRALIALQDDGAELYRVGDASRLDVVAGERWILYLPSLVEVVRVR